MNIKTVLTHILILFCVSLYSQYDSIYHDGVSRTFLVHLPAGYSGNSKLPLVLALHGGLGNAYNIENQSQFSQKADEEHFIVVYPEGIIGGSLDVSSWNAGWCCGYASKSNSDDIGFINSLLDTLITQYAVDTNRIYVTGMSNGGFMSYRLACELSNRIAAIAPVAASMSVSDCNQQRSVPVISFHSYLDTNVPYEGGIGDGISKHYNAPQDSVLNVWAALNYCSVLRDTVVENDQYTEIRWSNCRCSNEIYQYITQDGGHSWPGGNQTAIGDLPSVYLSATDLIWDFFRQYSLDCNQTSFKDMSVRNNLISYSYNPSKKLIRIETTSNWSMQRVSIFSPEGKQLSTHLNQTDIDISFLSNGLFIIQIDIDGDIQTGKILKQY